MRRKNLDLLLALAVAVINAGWNLANLTSLTGVSVTLTLLLILATGYTLTETLFPLDALEPVQRMAFSLALSIAATILSGFVLNQFAAGLRALPWALWLGLLVVTFSLLAYTRRRRPGAALPPQEPKPTITRQQRLRFQASSAVLFSMATLVVVLSVVYSVIGAEEQSHPGFTQLWLLPVSQGSNTCAIRVGMQSFELAPVSYNVVVTTNKAATAHWDVVSLVPQQQWIQVVPVSAGTDTSLVVLVQIYRLDHPQVVYRHVDVTLHVVSKAGTPQQCTWSFASPPAQNVASAYDREPIL